MFLHNNKDILNIMLKINFLQLRQVLKKLGFNESWVKGSHVTFNNPQANALILLSTHQKGDDIRPAYLRMVEKVLEEKGIIQRQQFESLFHSYRF